MKKSASSSASTVSDKPYCQHEASDHRMRIQAEGVPTHSLKGGTSTRAEMLALSDDEYWMCIVERATD